MKKIYSLLSILFLCSAIAMAQSPANRTVKTVVADVLAQMPTQKQGQYNNQINDLMVTGEEGIIQLVKMMQPPGGENNKIEYALSGLVFYVAGDDKLETQRVTTSKALVKALDMVTERETKAFIVRLLEVAGKDEAVPKLGTLLTDKSLSAPAAQALAAINSEASADALLEALKSTKDNDIKQEVVIALGRIKKTAAEPTLIAMLGSENADVEKSVLTALGSLGSKESIKPLSTAAAAINYKMNDTGATEAYIALTQRLLATGDVKLAEKEANNLMKAGEKYSVKQVRLSALDLQMAIAPQNSVKLLQKELKDPQKEYRCAVLNTAANYANIDMYNYLLKLLPKAKSENKVEIMNWFVEQCKFDNNNRNALSKLGTDILVKELANPNLEVKAAAAHTLVHSGGHNAIIALTSLLTSNDEKVVAIGKDALMLTRGDISTAIAPVLNSASEAGKIAGLELIALRKSDANAAAVFGQLNASSPKVKTAAYAALKEVVKEKDQSKLYTLLESVDLAEVPAMQQAVVATLKTQPLAKQYETAFAQMNKANKDKQHLYYPVLASTGSDKALNYIVNAFDKESEASQTAAFQALLDWRGQEAGAKLLAVAKDNSKKSFHMRAIDRYIELASSPKLTGENCRLLLTNAIEVATTDAQKNKILTALGKTNSYLGMLLASKYLDEKAVQQSAALTVMNIALANKSFTGAEVEALLNKVSTVLDNPDAGYQRQAISKHLSELPKKQGFVSIFNGKNIDGWKGLVGNPISRSKMTAAELEKKQTAADEMAQKHWVAHDDVLVFDGGGSDNADNLCTVKQYADFEMYIDWNLDPAGPEADAGIYLRGTPQVQMWDISRVNVGAQVGSGGLYNNNPNVSKPLKVADNKLGEWNTLYIKMVGDRVTVKLNGQLVVDNIILDNYWNRKMPIFVKEQLELQAHGSKVYYRNIYVKELESAKAFELSAEEQKEGYKMLFDGTNMHAWTGNNVDYKLDNGTIALDPAGRHGGNLYTRDEYSDFVFRFEFQLTPGANNGLGIRTPMKGDAAYVGMELQILDNDAPIYSELEQYQYHGSVYGIIAAKKGFLKPMGEWNYQEVEAKGNKIKITLNGTVIIDGDLKEATQNGTLDGKDHPGLSNDKGHIGFLGHGSPVKFRNIRVKELKK